MGADGGSGGMMGVLKDIFEAWAHRVVASGDLGLVFFLGGGEEEVFFVEKPLFGMDGGENFWWRVIGGGGWSRIFDGLDGLEIFCG